MANHKYTMRQPLHGKPCKKVDRGEKAIYSIWKTGLEPHVSRSHRLIVYSPFRWVAMKQIEDRILNKAQEGKREIPNLLANPFCYRS